MKKIIALILAMTLFSISAYADTALYAQTADELTATAEVTIPEPTFSSVSVHLQLDSLALPLKAQTLVFDLRDGETNDLLDSKTLDITSETPQFVDLNFSAGEYSIGKTFFLHLSQGEAELGFNGSSGAYFAIQTYSTPTPDGASLEYCTDFYMTLSPAREEAALPAQEPTFNSVTVHLQLDSTAHPLKAQTLVFDLRDGETNDLLDSKALNITSGMPQFADLNFAAGNYAIGKSFFLHMSQGEAELSFNGNSGAYFAIQTYSTPTPDGASLKYCTDFYMTLSPERDKIVNLRLDGKPRTDLALYTYPEGILISAAALEALGIESSFLEGGGLNLHKSEVSLLLYPDQLYAYKNSADIFNLSLAPQFIDGGLYVPVADVASYFGCPIDYSDNGTALNLSLGYATVGQTADEKLINSKNVSSDTDYLIWVSKSEFTVRVYQGTNGSWKRINSFACAIGAPSSPTIEGTFKYYQYQPRWEYAAYYVGPVMRFYRGYAIHSTLLRYNGTDYDGRTGVKISHGCVRVRPENINWLVDTIPLNTTVYVTA
ncbi:MAG: L,D-transpeptidase family protein [Oscillospiraceae bacterium]|nr:L,D-transpeptidase family protein [Oscillospiraceae bacterium]